MTRPLEPLALPHLRLSSHTTYAPSTGFCGTPVGAMENYGRISPSAPRFSNSPLLHSRVLENPHPTQTRAQTHFQHDSHFSYRPTGTSIFLINSYTQIHRSRRALHPTRANPATIVPPRPHAVPCTQPNPPIRVIQRTTPVFHAPFTREIATIGVKKRLYFLLPASCYTLWA
jgi:hypothetical protein